MKHKKSSKKARPANEVTEQEVDKFLTVIRNFKGYPKLRDLGKLLPSMSPYKISVLLRYLERSKTIIVDNDGYIAWVRKEKPASLTLGEVADIEEGLKEFLSKGGEN